MIIATAGHIDHGKTSLVRALTGAETDRLPEERARGISIDLGFAHWRPWSDVQIGFVDVPGHERFIRNMIAGVAGVDFALLAVAADDGVMPQTIEHLQILDLLGIARGIAVVTKCDRATTERVEAVRRDITALLAAGRRASMPIVAVSTLAGSGIDELGRRLIEAAQAEPRANDDAHNFRMAIDRAFTISGAGTVVTGTILDGNLEMGDRLTLEPSGIEVRVRSIERGCIAVERARAGDRCAVNLGGAALADAKRGSWLVAPGMGAPAARMDVRLELLDAEPRPLKHDSRVHVHLGTADISARVLIHRQSSIAPGGKGFAQLVLDQPTVAVTGDRFVIRDQSGQRLVGGGRVLVPSLPVRRRKDRNYDQILAAMEHDGAGQALGSLLAIDGHEVERTVFSRAFNLTANTATKLFEQFETVAAGSAELPSTRVSTIHEQVVAQLSLHHRAHPEAAGMPVRALHQQLTQKVSPDTFTALLKSFASQGTIVANVSVARLSGHSPAFSPFDAALWQQILPWLEERGPRLFTAADAARETRSSEAAMQAMLYRRRSSGDIWRIGKDHLMLRQHVASLAASAAELSAEHEDGFTAAQFRDRSGIGRNLTIKVLEFFDAIAVTGRRGDLRRVTSGYQDVVGADLPVRHQSPDVA